MRPRKSSPGITLSREESCMDVIYIDHKQVIGKSREKTITDNNQDPDWEPDGDLMKSTITVFEPISGAYWFYPVSGYGTETVKAALRTWFMTTGGQANVVCDNAPCFTALKDWLLKWYGSKLHTTAAYHPCANLAERAHRNFEAVLNKYDSVSKEYNFQNWQDNLSLACRTQNSLKNVKFRESPYEILLNRTQRDIEPLKFFPTGREQNRQLQRWTEKCRAIDKSTLKRILPVFVKGQKVKLMVPHKQVEYGIVTTDNDNEHNKTVHLSIRGNIPFGFSKDHIGVPKNGVAVEDSKLDDSVMEDEFLGPAVQNYVHESSKDLIDSEQA